MTEVGGLVRERTIFDHWKSLTIGTYMALTGYAVMVGLPVLSTSWVEHLGFTEIQVGRVAGADLGGFALGALLAAMLVARVDRRHLAVSAAVFTIAVNLVCIYNTGYEITVLLRFLAGTGSGVFTGIAIATIAGHSRPAFAFSVEIFFFAWSQGAELKFLPYLSLEGIYVVFIITYVIGILFISWLPRRPAENPIRIEADPNNLRPADHRVTVPAYVPWLVLLAIVVTYIGIGGYWTYVELSTVDSAADPEWVASVLWVSSVFSLTGCVVAVLLSNRYGLARPLFVTLILQAAIVVMLVFGITNLTVAISMFAFNFLWVFIDVFQDATIANVDQSGKFPAMIPAAQGLGNFLGPNVAASVLAWGFGYNGVFVMCGIASIVAMLVYLYMYLALKKAIPALADAS